MPLEVAASFRSFDTGMEGGYWFGAREERETMGGMVAGFEITAGHHGARSAWWRALERPEAAAAGYRDPHQWPAFLTLANATGTAIFTARGT